MRAARAHLEVSIFALVLGVAPLLGACAPEPESKPERPPKLRKQPVPVAAPTPAPTPAPSPPPADDTPTLIPAAPSQWWCLCYQRQADEGPEPVTACREDAQQCRKLEQRIAKGNKDIIAGSLSVGCRTLTGNHPSDIAGTREQWQPSALRGAWVAEGACLLNELAPASELEPPPEPSAPLPPPADPSVFLSSELVGDFSLGRSSAEIRSRHGEPVTMGAIEELAATGEFVQDWSYGDGLVLSMSSTTRSGPQSLAGVTIEAPSKLQTRRGIGIGDARAAVERAYGDVEADDYNRGAHSFVAGSIYGGLYFSFDDGAVSRIFLGVGDF